MVGPLFVVLGINLFDNLTIYSELQRGVGFNYPNPKAPENTDQNHLLSIDMNTICQQALDDVIEKNTIKNYQYYLDYYVKAPVELRQKATSNRNVLAYSDASEINTIESFQEFIDSYPNALQNKKLTTSR